MRFSMISTGKGSPSKNIHLPLSQSIQSCPLQKRDLGHWLTSGTSNSFFFNSFPHGPPDPNRVISYSTGLCPRKLTKNELLQQQFNRRVRVTSGKESHETSLEDLDLVHKSDKEPATPNKVYFKSLPTEDNIYASSSDDSRSIHAKTFIEDNDGWEIVENEG